jgi:serine/threonine-protein kinase HipA
MSGDIAVFAAAGDENVLAGRMYSHRRQGVESASFIYDGRFLASPGTFALDPALPLVAGTLQTPVNRPLFGAFADSLPDRWGRMLIRREERARASAAGTTPRSMSEVDLLLGVRDDLRQGALRFRADDRGPFLATEDSGVPVLADLSALLDIAARVEQDTANYDELKQLLQAGSSQAKQARALAKG